MGKKTRRGGALPSTRDEHQMAPAPSHRSDYLGVYFVAQPPHLGNRVSGAKWGIVRMPHSCNRLKQNKTSCEPTEHARRNRTVAGRLVFGGGGYPSKHLGYMDPPVAKYCHLFLSLDRCPLLSVYPKHPRVSRYSTPGGCGECALHGLDDGRLHSTFALKLKEIMK